MRERRPSLAYTLESLVSTVFGVTKRAAAISLFERPSAASAAMRRSVGVSSPVAGAAPADAGELGTRLVGPEARAELARSRQRLLERLSRRPLHPRAPSRRAQRQQRAGVLERHRDSLVLGKRLLERAERAFEIAARGGETSPRQRAADASAEARSSCAPWRSRMLEQRLGLFHATERDQRFDLVGGEAHRAGLPDTARLEPRAERAEQPVHRIEPLERELQKPERASADDRRHHHAALLGAPRASISASARAPSTSPRAARTSARTPRAKSALRLLVGLERELDPLLGVPPRLLPASRQELGPAELGE